MSIDLAKLEFCPLTDKSNSAIKNFDCGDKDLNEFLIKDSLLSQELYLSNTMLVYSKGKLIGYYTLACDSIRLDKSKERKEFPERKQIQSYPAIKIARMAFIEECHNQGCGTLIISYVLGFAHRLNKRGIGCRFITVDAYPEKVDFYLKRGFKYNVHQLYKKNNHPSLRLDVWSAVYGEAIKAVGKDINFTNHNQSSR